MKALHSTITIKTPKLKLGPSEALGLPGSTPELGLWSKAINMDASSPAFASATIAVKSPFEYKFVIADPSNGAIRTWEEGSNRYFDGSMSIINAPAPRLRAEKWKGAGVAIPVFSLRSEESFGVGEFYDLRKLVDWAVLTGQSIIQLLPIIDTTMTGKKEDSYPYNANSTFALHPQFLHLPACGVPEDEEYCALRAELNALETVDYERVNEEKTRLLKQAFKSTGRKTLSSKGYKKFIEDNHDWLLPYAAFRVLTALAGSPDFTTWGKYSKYSKALLDEIIAANKSVIHFDCFEQSHLSKQFSEVKAYAHSHGVMLKGDLPIGISRTSADAWINPKLFNLDSQAGAPPDAFSVNGQNWGFPTYNWERMSKDGYAWWKARLGKMAECFDAFRIDHILGFFRIWEIPIGAVHGLLGHFNPALPYTAIELRNLGFDISDGKYITPITEDWVFDDLFGERAAYAKRRFLRNGCIKNCKSTQRKIAEQFANDVTLRDGFMEILEDVLFIEDPRQKGMYHPRIAAQSTRNYALLPQWQKDAFNRLYDDFFYRRHNNFWREEAMKKLPALLSATNMLTCGEDLGMIPDCVPSVMNELQILSLEIQRMPKNPWETFGNTASYPYLSVCTTSTHDMNPLRAWWEEDRDLSQKFYNEVLGCGDFAPFYCEPWLCEKVIRQHLNSPAMLVILPIQDWLSTDGNLRRENPNDERINIPAIPRHYWRYRMHLTLEQLLQETALNASIRSLIHQSGR